MRGVEISDISSAMRVIMTESPLSISSILPPISTEIIPCAMVRSMTDHNGSVSVKEDRA